MAAKGEKGNQGAGKNNMALNCRHLPEKAIPRDWVFLSAVVKKQQGMRQGLLGDVKG